ncbi:uncharacterized protein CYBJADRAFT_169372 [Cyberlindnera jadinii NRRL Y-1542]|uniref:Uncharacterized protein n=1 Tax=Cyberlindnera jadinii (strain ATCC 18201 / CBS 1600 / BCRC 20928 / JCM 3617 / NBRC 0987 / NRRL Y-1542) TaxID=983966 RepID=A0A1E4RWA6_CYBJN|nr:hypothetical protein CYBJADRAFT_169372 [Cyberlindnera jadinii NRRL Y-1542]ODV71526.1 hypothetical protein CYBJADRAFT_169372 [Cyberlindnera jadinii NRRL Y-1542]
MVVHSADDDEHMRHSHWTSDMLSALATLVCESGKHRKPGTNRMTHEALVDISNGMTVHFPEESHVGKFETEKLSKRLKIIVDDYMLVFLPLSKQEHVVGYNPQLHHFDVACGNDTHESINWAKFTVAKVLGITTKALSKFFTENCEYLEIIVPFIEISAVERRAVLERIATLKEELGGVSFVSVFEPSLSSWRSKVCLDLLPQMVDLGYCSNDQMKLFIRTNIDITYPDWKVIRILSSSDQIHDKFQMLVDQKLIEA